MDFQSIDAHALAAKLAGVAGSLASMRFLSGTWPSKLSMAASGSVLAYFGSPFLSEKVGLPEGLAGFLLGMFGMAIASRAWEVIQEFPIGKAWEAAIAFLLGSKRG